MSIPSVYNEPALGKSLRTIISKEMGDSAWTTVKPVMIGEDFGVYGRQQKSIPSYLLWIGTVAPDRKAKAANGQEELHSLHSSKFAPAYTRTIPAAVKMMSSCLLHLFKAKQ